MNDSKYANDAAVLGDGFGPERAGDQVAKMALEADTPFTIGVTGKWGSGKTSVLRRAFVTLGGRPVQAEALLGEAMSEISEEERQRWAFSGRVEELRWQESLRRRAERSLCVWYSPWQHQGAGNPLVPLLLEMRAQFTTRIKVGKSLGEINRRGGLAAITLLERLADSAVSLVLDRDAKLAGTTEAVRAAWREAAPAEPGLDDGQRFHLLFEDAVEALLDGLKKDRERTRGRVIVFVDDLDRCEDEAAVQLLEAIKLYLGSHHCVFVLAMDDSALLDALRRTRPGRSEDGNREYLEKLFQVMVPVPLPAPQAVQLGVAEQLKEHGVPDDADCAAMIADLVEPNPRKVKNFVNSVCAAWGLFSAAPEYRSGDEEQRCQFARRLVLFHYLRTFHREVWRLLERQQWALRILHKVLVEGTDQDVMLPEGVRADDQRILELLFFRAFAHVLRDTGDEPQLHRHLPIAEAVDLLNQRLDRKRSDDRFIVHFRELVEPNMDLPHAFLHLYTGDAHA